MQLILDEQLSPYAEPVYVERGVDVNGLMWAVAGVGAVFVAFWFGFILAALMAYRRVGQLHAQVRELSARNYDEALTSL